MTTTRTVSCVKLKKEAPGLEKAPFPGELGKRLLESVSEEAWGLWLEHQKAVRILSKTVWILFKPNLARV